MAMLSRGLMLFARFVVFAGLTSSALRLVLRWVLMGLLDRCRTRFLKKLGGLILSLVFLLLVFW